MGRWEPCEKPGMLEWKATWYDKARDILKRTDYVRPRYLVVAAMLLFSFIQFGADPLKSLAASFAAYVLMVLPLGARYIERGALIAFCSAVVMWLGILPNETASLLGRKLSNLLPTIL